MLIYLFSLNLQNFTNTSVNQLCEFLEFKKFVVKFPATVIIIDPS